MFTIANDGTIRLTRGDTFSTSVLINIGTDEVPARYVLRENDKLYFAVCEPNQKWEDALIKKTFDNTDLDDRGDVVVKFSTEDTEYIEPGTYYYQIKFFMAATENTKEKIDTIVPRTKFIVVE